MKLVGLDLSLSSTGVAVATIDDNDVRVATHTVSTKHTGPERLSVMRKAIWAHVEGAELTVIEGYAFGAGGTGKAGTPSHAHGIGELGGVVKCTIFERAHLAVDVNIAHVKLYATGRGNAKKDEVFAEAIRRLGYSGTSKDEADALWLVAAACDWMGHPLVKMPDKNREAIGRIGWPEGLR